MLNCCSSDSGQHRKNIKGNEEQVRVKVKSKCHPLLLLSRTEISQHQFLSVRRARDLDSLQLRRKQRPLGRYISGAPKYLYFEIWLMLSEHKHLSSFLPMNIFFWRLRYGSGQKGTLYPQTDHLQCTCYHRKKCPLPFCNYCLQR